MAKRRANGEGNIRKRSDGRWEGRYTAGRDPDTGCDRTGYLRNRDTAGQAGETMENQRRGAGNGWKQGGKVRI